MQWVGFAVTKDDVVLVQLSLHEDGGVTVENDVTWNLQNGERPPAYYVMFKRVADYVRDRKIDAVVLIGSSVSGHAAKLGLLTGAELRGVVAAAAASVLGRVEVHSKGTLSRASSRGRVDKYVSDESYWVGRIKSGNLRKGSREAAYAVLASAKVTDGDQEPR